jgi:hypothetical protein
MPSVADLIFIGLLVAMVFTPLSMKLLGDAGIGWHIRTGQQILSSHSIPHVDPFSSQIAKPWFAWEWLYDVVVGKLEAWCGLNGVVGLSAIVIAAVFGWMFRLLIARGTNFFAALALVLLAVSASTVHLFARPHVLSWLFTLAWFWILDSTEQRSSQEKSTLRSCWLWTLPISMLVWVNVHGGFLLGFALLAIFWLGSVWIWLRLKESRIEESLQKIAAGKRAWDLFWVGVASAVASLVNPYGWKLHAHIYGYLTNRFLMDHIEEFQSPNFHLLAQRCFLLLLLVSLAILLAHGRRLCTSHSLIVLLAVYMSLTASRSIPTSSILLGMIAGPLLYARPNAEALWNRLAAVESQMRGHLWPILAIGVTFAIATNGGRIGSSQVMDARFDPKRMPVDAVNFLEEHQMEEHQIRGPILSPDYWGGYLIYRLYPNDKVVIDDRHDFYGEEFLKSYLTTWHVEPGWANFLNRHRAPCLVLPKSAALSTILVASPEWKSIYSDEVAIVFVHTKPPEDSDRIRN